MMATKTSQGDGVSAPDSARLPSQASSRTDLVPTLTKSDTLGKAHKHAAARERMCIVTRKSSEETDLIRFVLDPSGVLVPDLKANLPGRGAWVSAKRAILQDAVKRKAFGRAFKGDQPVLGLDDLVMRTEEVLKHHARGSLALARKAGLVTTGFSKVESAIKAGKVECVLHASDAGHDGRGKLDRLAGHMNVSTMSVLTHDEMGLALGVEHVIHAALLNGPGAPRFLVPLRRLEMFCTNEAMDQSDGPTNAGMKTGNHRGSGPGDKTAL